MESPSPHMAGLDGKAADEAAKGKAASLMHDRFNMVFIPPIVALTGLSLLKSSDRQAGVHTALTWTTFGYIVADIFYNALVPRCQPGKVRLGSILFHHFVTCWLLWHPIKFPDEGHITALCTIVEVNTVFQTMNKIWKRKIFQQGFMATWFSMRLLWYPYLVYRFHWHMKYEFMVDVGSYEYCQVVGSQFLLSGLNFFWTAEFLAAGKKNNGAEKTVKDK
mmetsp:Transcript_85247/g.244788  ORF Transcript_85247/g.244788 Transcript_85247/m.244788 type:complete len:220 (-) Transcript_85247:130-789(-)